MFQVKSFMFHVSCFMFQDYTPHAMRMTAQTDRQTGSNALSDSARRGDGAVLMEDKYEADLRCKLLMDKCTDRLSSVMYQSPLYTEKDFELEKRGLKMFAERGQAEELEMSIRNTDDLKSTLDRAESDFKSKIALARRNRWITEGTAEYWLRQMSSKKYHWSEKVSFINNRFPHLMQNWERMTNDINTIKKGVEKNPELMKIPEIEKIITGKGLKQYTNWRETLDIALGSMAAEAKNFSDLFNEAQKILEGAVKQKVLSPSKVGAWLIRIFKSGSGERAIRKFVQGSDGHSLKGLIGRWAEARARYDILENKRKTAGAPRGFNFATTDKFLEWHYAKRIAYLEEAERRYADISKENPLILEIRRELDSCDWESAAHLIQKAEHEMNSPEEFEKLKSMKKYLAEHGTESDKEEKNEFGPMEAKAELEKILSLLPVSLASLYHRAIRIRKFGCISSLMYNRVWCHDHSRLSKNKEKRMEEEATELTEERIERGDDGKQHVVSDVDSFKQPSIRSYTYTGINKAQTLFVSSQGHDALIARMEEEDSYLFRYWTTLIPENVDYGTHSYIVKNLNPRIKKCLRVLENTAVLPPANQKPSKASGTRSFAMAG